MHDVSAHTGRRWWQGPSLSTSWGLLAWLTVPLTAFLTIGPVREVDVYWHIRMGADILANGRFGGDPGWTFGPADVDWVTTQAGAELLLHAIHLVASWPGIMLFRVVMAAVVMTSVLLAVTRVVRTRSRLAVDRSVAVVAVLAMVLMVEYVQERPQTLSLAILPWVGVLVLRVMYTDRWPRWWVIGLLVMAWSWFHGAATLVAPLLAVAALIHALGVGGLRWVPVLATSVRRGWLVILVAALAPMIGPAGLGYYSQAAAIQDAASMRIIEWTPAAANSAYVWAVLVLVAVWAFALVRLAARSGTIWRTFRMDALLVIPAVLVMTTSGRYLGLGFLILAPLVVRRLAQAWTRPAAPLERMKRPVAIVLLSLVSALTVLVAGAAAAGVRPVDLHHPLRVWDALSQSADERRVVVAYVLGGQAGLLGDAVVSIDGRADRYGGALIDANRDLVDGRPGWRDTLALYDGATDAVVPSGGALVELLVADGWVVACVDGGFTWLTAPGVTGACPSEGAD